MLSQTIRPKPIFQGAGVGEIETRLRQPIPVAGGQLLVHVTRQAEDAHAARQQLLGDGGAESARDASDDRDTTSRG